MDGRLPTLLVSCWCMLLAYYNLQQVELKTLSKVCHRNFRKRDMQQVGVLSEGHSGPQWSHKTRTETEIGLVSWG